MLNAARDSKSSPDTCDRLVQLTLVAGAGKATQRRKMHRALWLPSKGVQIPPADQNEKGGLIQTALQNFGCGGGQGNAAPQDASGAVVAEQRRSNPAPPTKMKRAA